LIIANSERLGYFESVKTLRREAHRDEAIFNSKENQLPQESWYREVSGGFLRGRDNSWGFLLGGGDLVAEKHMYVMGMRLFPLEKADFIDEGIRPLVRSIGEWEGIETTNSCDGHNTDRPFVVFQSGGLFKTEKGAARKLANKLSERIKGTNWGIFAESSEGVKGCASFYLRPFKRAKSYASVDEIAELVKTKNPKRPVYVAKYEYDESGKHTFKGIPLKEVT